MDRDQKNIFKKLFCFGVEEETVRENEVIELVPVPENEEPPPVTVNEPLPATSEHVPRPRTPYFRPYSGFIRRTVRSTPDTNHHSILPVKFKWLTKMLILISNFN